MDTYNKIFGTSPVTKLNAEDLGLMFSSIKLSFSFDMFLIFLFSFLDKSDHSRDFLLININALLVHVVLTTTKHKHGAIFIHGTLTRTHYRN